MKKWRSFPVLVGFLFSILLTASFLYPTGTDAFDRDSKWDTVYSKGSRLYLTHCAACHGKNGKGGVGLPLNLQSFLSVAPEGYIRRSIFYGRLPRQMIPYGTFLKKEDIEAIATYVRS